MAVRRPAALDRRTTMRSRSKGEDFRVPHAHFWADAIDGTRLAGTMLGDAPGGTALVLAHGFMGYRRKVRNRLLAEALSAKHRVFAFDMRGHGESSGSCSGGAVEDLDVEAVVDYARRRGFERIVTVGWSLGGIAVVRHAANYAGLDGVVAISTPSRWSNTSPAVRRTTWIFTSPVGRALARGLMGTRIDLRLDVPDPPAAIAGKIAPTPLLVVHGTNDHFFGRDAGREIFAAANEPKRLLEIDGFGHAEDGFTRAFAERLAGEIDAMLASV